MLFEPQRSLARRFSDRRTTASTSVVSTRTVVLFLRRYCSFWWDAGGVHWILHQSKASRAMMMEMQPGMMAHMGNHMDMTMHGAMGGMDCPMMKMDVAHEAEAEKKTPKM